MQKQPQTKKSPVKSSIAHTLRKKNPERTMERNLFGSGSKKNKRMSPLLSRKPYPRANRGMFCELPSFRQGEWASDSEAQEERGQRAGLINCRD